MIDHDQSMMWGHFCKAYNSIVYTQKKSAVIGAMQKNKRKIMSWFGKDTVEAVGGAVTGTIESINYALSGDLPLHTSKMRGKL